MLGMICDILPIMVAWFVVRDFPKWSVTDNSRFLELHQEVGVASRG